MRQIAPDGPVYQAGTLSGNPLATAAGIAALEALRDGSVYAHTAALCERLCNGMAEAAAQAGIPRFGTRLESMSCGFFCEGPVRNYADAKTCDTERYAAFFHGMLDRGFYVAPSQFETGFVSRAHTEFDIDATVEAAREVFGTLSTG